eukprot:TRINITY_DN9579_c0_g1_i1.p1 TRINITY_DN9579_c0_g1~~TRINITY_DN9579_c0_g1_i1.p1  ORF type:complete len:416 (+),score=99.91 TRINITY_DN9579_c0_g1_i1:63-1310(+)
MVMHDTLLGHGIDAADLQAAVQMTSFLKVPGLSLMKDAASWVSNHLPGHSQQAESDAAAAKSDPDVQRVVDYYSADCPHSQALAPIFKAARQDWEAGGHQVKLVWEKKECYGPGWKTGKDFDECQQAEVDSYPTIKWYYGKKDKYGEEILEQKDSDRLLDFIESRADPDAWYRKTLAFGLTPEQEEAGLDIPHDIGPPTKFGGGTVVDYAAKDCVHCQMMEPVWKNAKSMWLESHAGNQADVVKWEQKECFGPRWAPGKDYDECQKQGIHTFPTIRFHGKDGDAYEDFTGDRSAKSLLNFVNRSAEPPDSPDDSQQVEALPSSASKARVSAEEPLEPKDKVAHEEPTSAAKDKVPLEQPKASSKAAKDDSSKGALKAPEQASLSPILPALLFRSQDLQARIPKVSTRICRSGGFL